MFRTDDPIADFERYDREQAEHEATLPHCDECGEAIYESYYEIHNELICDKCIEQFKQYVD